MKIKINKFQPIMMMILSRNQTGLFDYIQECYEQQKYCDLSLNVGSDPIFCHRVILASIFPWIKDALVELDQDYSQIFIPGASRDRVKKFIDHIYYIICDKSSNLDLEQFQNVYDIFAAMPIQKDGVQGQSSDLDIKSERSDSISLKRKAKSQPKIQDSKRRIVESYSDSNTDDSNPLQHHFSTLFRNCDTMVDNVTVCFDAFPSVASEFQVLIALNPDSFHAKAIAFSHPTLGTELETQFQDFLSAVSDQLSMSNSDFLVNHGAKLGFNLDKMRKELFDEYFGGFKVKSKGVLETELHQLANNAQDVKGSGSKASDSNRIWNCHSLNIQLVPELSSPFELAILSYEAGTICLYPLTRESSPVCGDIYLETLISVWRIPKSILKKRLKSKVENELSPVVLKDVINHILDDSASEKQCQECGENWPYITKRDKIKYKSHLEKHEKEKFHCDCKITLQDPAKKKKHILLNHSKGKFIKCDLCAFIGTPKQVDSHLQNNHKTYICDICGKKVPTKSALCVHMLDHKTYKCEICGIEILGRHKYARHKDTNHTGSWPCDVCGNTFKSKQYMLKHVSIMHQTDEMKPFRCDECGKGFVTTNSLKTHRMSAHIKTRPYACRYGCGAAYNDSSNRGHHERKKHGGNFDPSKHQNVAGNQ